MSSAGEKELAAGSLRWYAARLESALDAVPGLSATAWDCPAADDLLRRTASEAQALDAAAAVVRGVAAALDVAAAAQRADDAVSLSPADPPSPIVL